MIYKGKMARLGYDLVNFRFCNRFILELAKEPKIFMPLQQMLFPPSLQKMQSLGPSETTMILTLTRLISASALSSIYQKYQ